MVEMVVEQSRQGFAKRYRRCDLRRKRSRERGRAATGMWDCFVQTSPSPLLYIGGKGKGLVAALGPSSKEGRRLGRKLASQGKWTPSHLGFPLPLAHGPCGAGAPRTIRLGSPPLQPIHALGAGGILPNSSGTLRNLPEASRYNTGKTRNFFGSQNMTSHI